MVKTKLLLSALVCYQYNFKILHWKAKGKHFDRLHEMMNEYYDKYGEYVDAVAEILLMNPDEAINPPTLAQAIEDLNSSERKFLMLDTSDSFDLEEGFKVIKELLLTTEQLAIEAKPELPAPIDSAYDDMLYWLYVEMQYKMERRL